MLNSLYALILTDSLHLPTTIGYFNTRPAACQARQSAHAWLKGESQSVESLNCFSNAAVNILDQCRTAIEKNPAHYVDLRVKPVDDLSDPETTPFRVYYETAAGDRYFTVMETATAPPPFTLTVTTTATKPFTKKLLILTPLMISSLTLFASLCSSSAVITTYTMLLTAKSNLPR